jgi:hypothetical protein
VTRPKPRGRVTAPSCEKRSLNYHKPLPHKFSSSYNGISVCSWCGRPQHKPAPRGPSRYRLPTRDLQMADEVPEEWFSSEHIVTDQYHSLLHLREEFYPDGKECGRGNDPR